MVDLQAAAPVRILWNMRGVQRAAYLLGHLTA